AIGAALFYPRTNELDALRAHGGMVGGHAGEAVGGAVEGPLPSERADEVGAGRVERAVFPPGDQGVAEDHLLHELVPRAAAPEVVVHADVEPAHRVVQDAHHLLETIGLWRQ